VVTLVRIGLCGYGPESQFSAAIAIGERRCYGLADSGNSGSFELEAADYPAPRRHLNRRYHVGNLGGEGWVRGSMDLDPGVDGGGLRDLYPFGIEVSAVRATWHGGEPFHIAATTLLYEELVLAEVPPVWGGIICWDILGPIGFSHLLGVCWPGRHYRPW
jgi:hypothetical protein